MLHRSPQALILVILQLLSCWPVLRWYGARTMDTSDGLWGVVALATFLLLLIAGRQPENHRGNWALPTALMLLYSVSYHFLPPLLRAAIAVSALGSTVMSLYGGKSGQAGFYGLLLLALPVVPTMQFYLGYPLRVLSGTLTVPLLQLVGFPVVLDGAMLDWGGQPICIDAPCSGIKMLWAGLFLTCVLAAHFRLSATRVLMAATGCLVIVTVANAFRATALFFVESGLYPFPTWFHNGAGLVVFCLAAVAITALNAKLKEA